MWEAKPWLSSLPTTARLMNILEAKHRWKSTTPTRPHTSEREIGLHLFLIDFGG
jgi:hypothetical protein